MGKPLQVLIVEDRPADAELMARELGKAGFEVDWQRVVTERDFRLRLTPRLDLILCDYGVPGFGAVPAMAALRESGLDIPLIVVSGSIGDERTAECLKMGAVDYVLKDRLARLGPAAARARQDHEERAERRRLREALRQSEERMRTVLGTVEDVVWSLSLSDFRVIYMSPAGEKMFGRPIEDFYGDGKLWVLSVHPDDRQAMLDLQKSMIRWGTGEGRMRILRPDHSIRHVQVRAWCAYREDGAAQRLEGICSDVTERLQQEEALRRQHEMLEEAQAIAHIGSWEWDPQADETILSKEGWRIWGLEPGRIRRRKAFMDLVHPDDRPALEAATARAATEGQDYDCTVRIRTPAGERHARHRGRVLARNEAGVPSRLAGTIEDVTEQVNAEARRVQLEEARREGERLAHLNEFKTTFLSMVAHDLNNVLTPVRIYSRMAHEQATAKGLDPKATQGVQAGVKRLAAFLADLLDASRLQAGHLALRLARVDWAAVVAGAVEAAQAAAREKGIALEARLPAEAFVQGDAHRLDQVVTNLLSNALKFTPPGGRVEVSMESGPGWTLSVVDSGRGIPPDEMGKLFQPFSRLTSTEQGKHTGTGLGLFIAKGVVEGHGGRITCHSEGTGRGCTFKVEVPTADG